jgi:hypothetical protein
LLDQGIVLLNFERFYCAFVALDDFKMRACGAPQKPNFPKSTFSFVGDLERQTIELNVLSGLLRFSLARHGTNGLRTPPALIIS